MTLAVEDVGRVSYLPAWELQKRRVDEGEEGLLVVEHDDVVTVGRGTKEPLPGAVEVERGGQATWHGPGQIVVYPIVRLAEGRRDLHAWMRALEEAVIATLDGFGIHAQRKDGATGVWVGGALRKICSIGVAARKWTTYHGLALNHDPDLSRFAAIRPCGFDAGVMTSMREELGDACPDRQAVVDALVRHLQATLAPFRS